jgi:hypothetical protein
MKLRYIAPVVVCLAATATAANATKNVLSRSH